jgi:hypothetical protein
MFPTYDPPPAMPCYHCSVIVTQYHGFGHYLDCPIWEQMLDDGKLGEEYGRVYLHLSELGTNEWLKANSTPTRNTQRAKDRTQQQVAIDKVRDDFLNWESSHGASKDGRTASDSDSELYDHRKAWERPWTPLVPLPLDTATKSITMPALPLESSSLHDEPLSIKVVAHCTLIQPRARHIKPSAHKILARKTFRDLKLGKYDATIKAGDELPEINAELDWEIYCATDALSLRMMGHKMLQSASS